METSTYALFTLAVLGVVVWLAWRFASKRHALPCPVWLRWLVELDNPFTRTNRAAVIIEHLGLEPGMRVLDAGCGPGRVSIPAAMAIGDQGEVVALDIQEGMLRRAREKSAAAGQTNIRFVNAGLGEGRLEHEYYDRALLVTVLGEIPERKAALAEIFGALKPGGILSVTETVFDPHYQRRNTVEHLAADAGFEAAQFFGNRAAYTLHLRKP